MFKKNDKFAIHKIDPEGNPIGDPLGIHDSKRKAKAQQAALYASENRAAVKFAPDSDDIVEGLGMPFGGIHNGNDLSGEHFSKSTDFCFGWFQERPLLYHHGLDNGTGVSVIGRVKSWEVKSDKGVWVKAQLDKSNEYFDSIKELVAKGKLFLSSGSMRHLVDVDRRSGEIKRWPWVEMSMTPTPCNLLAEVGFSDASKHFSSAGLKSAFDRAYKAIWSAAVINDLPDEAFAYIESGGEKDKDDKTTPRSLRHFPYRNKDGELDAAHVRNALAWIPQSDLPEEAKSEALEAVEKAARALGIGKEETAKKSLKLDTPTVDAIVPEEIGGKPVSKKPTYAALIARIAADEDVDEDELAHECGDMSSMDSKQAKKHVAKHARMLAEPPEGKSAGAKALKTVPFEDLRCEVEVLLRKQMGVQSGPDPSAHGYCYVEKTFPTHMIASVCKDGAEKHYHVSFTLDASGHVVSISPVEVEESYLPKASVLQMPLGAQSDVVKMQVCSLVERARALHQSRLKEGRILSSANRERLQSCLDAMKEACNELEHLLGSTVVQPQMVGMVKTASVKRQQRLQMLKLYAATLGN